MKVLIVKTSSMGDVIHTFPAVTDALCHRPDLVFDWCVEPAFVDLVRLHPAIRMVHAAPVRDWLKRPVSGATLSGFRTLRQRLRAERYDLVLDAQGLIKSAILSKMAGAEIAGYDRASAREGIATVLYDIPFAVPRGLHAIARTRILFGAALGYQPDLAQYDSGLASTEPAGSHPRAFLLHGTSRPTKAWPIANWIAVARGLVTRGIMPVLTWSNEAERGIGGAIAASVPDTIVIPKSPLSAVAVEIERATLVIGVDTGLMHLADAYGRPTVALFLGSSPALTGPVGPRSAVLPSDARKTPERPRRRDRDHEPSAIVTPDQVLESADALLATATGP